MMIKKRKGKCTEITGGHKRLAGDDTKNREMSDRFGNEAVTRDSLRSYSTSCFCCSSCF